MLLVQKNICLINGLCYMSFVVRKLLFLASDQEWLHYCCTGKTFKRVIKALRNFFWLEKLNCIKIKENVHILKLKHFDFYFTKYRFMAKNIVFKSLRQICGFGDHWASWSQIVLQVTSTHIVFFVKIKSICLSCQQCWSRDNFFFKIKKWDSV